jgi:hypothetical protein
LLLPSLGISLDTLIVNFSGLFLCADHAWKDSAYIHLSRGRVAQQR